MTVTNTVLPGFPIDPRLHPVLVGIVHLAELSIKGFIIEPLSSVMPLFHNEIYRRNIFNTFAGML